MKERIINAIRKLDHRLFFPYMEETDRKRYYLYKEVMKYDYAPESLNNSPQPIRDYFEKCTKDWGLEKFHFCYTEGCTIEPSAGWAVTKDEKLIPESVWNNYVHRVNKPWYMKHRLWPKKRMHIPRAISLQYAWGNYWHFYNDILGQLALADKAGLPRDTPIIIAAGLARMNFFKDIMALSPDLSSRNWVLQDGKTHIYCDEAHFFNTFWDHRENFDGVLNQIGFRQKLQLPHPGCDRIFLSRNPRRGRNVRNMDELVPILAKYGFRLVDCDGLSVIDQVNLFQNAGFVIGIHGAGLTNIIYRQDRPMKLLELFSMDYQNPAYYWFCRQYGYEYYSLLGSAGNEAKTSTIGNFTIDAAEFEQSICKMLEAPTV